VCDIKRSAIENAYNGLIKPVSVALLIILVARQLTRAPRMKKTIKKRPIGVSQAMSP